MSCSKKLIVLSKKVATLPFLSCRGSTGEHVVFVQGTPQHAILFKTVEITRPVEAGRVGGLDPSQHLYDMPRMQFQSQNDLCRSDFEMRCFYLLVVSGHLKQALCYHVSVCGPRAFLSFLQMVAAMVAGPELCPDEGRVRGLARLDSPPEAHVIALFVTLDAEVSSNN